VYFPDQTEVSRPNFISFTFRSCIRITGPFRPPTEHFFYKA